MVRFSTTLFALLALTACVEQPAVPSLPPIAPLSVGVFRPSEQPTPSPVPRATQTVNLTPSPVVGPGALKGPILNQGRYPCDLSAGAATGPGCGTSLDGPQAQGAAADISPRATCCGAYTGDLGIPQPNCRTVDLTGSQPETTVYRCQLVNRFGAVLNTWEQDTQPCRASTVGYYVQPNSGVRVVANQRRR